MWPSPFATTFPAAAATTGSDLVNQAHSTWQGLHPASLAVNLIPQGWRTLRSTWPLFIALFIGGDMGGEELFVGVFELLLLGAFFSLAFLRTTVHWATLRYRLHEGRLEISHGLLNRQARIIDPARIQNIEVVQNLFHKATGLVELRLETAGDASTEGLLSALGESEARQLEARLRSMTGRHQPHALQTGAPPLLALGPLEIIAFGLTRRTVGTVAVLTAIGLELFANMGPQAARGIRMSPQLMVAAVILAFCASWAISAGTSLFRHHAFRLRKEGDRLITESGLTTRRRVEIPLAKVQLVRVDEPFLRRQMGYGTLRIETAGLGVVEGELRQAEGMVPMVEADALGITLRHALPTVSADPWSVDLLPAHPRALWRGLSQRMVRAAMLTGLCVVIFGPTGWWAALSAPVSVPIAWMDWRKQGWLVTPEGIIARRGWFTRRTWVVSRDKLQSTHLATTPFLRLAGLGRVIVRVAGSQIALPDLGINTAHRVLAELSEGQPFSAEEKVHSDDAGQGTRDVGGEARDHRMTDAGHTHTAEVDGQHIEGGLGASIHGAGDVADQAVGAMGLEQLGSDAEGPGTGQGAKDGQGQDLGGHADGGGDRAKEVDEGGETT